MRADIKDKKNLLEEQARRIDSLHCDLKSLQTKHEGHVHRLIERNRLDIEDIKLKFMNDLAESEIKL